MTISRGGRYLFAVEAGSGIISRYAIAREGGLALLDSTTVSATVGVGAAGRDAAGISPGRHAGGQARACSASQLEPGPGYLGLADDHWARCGAPVGEPEQKVRATAADHRARGRAVRQSQCPGVKVYLPRTRPGACACGI